MTYVVGCPCPCKCPLRRFVAAGACGLDAGACVLAAIAGELDVSAGGLAAGACGSDACAYGVAADAVACRVVVYRACVADSGGALARGRVCRGGGLTHRARGVRAYLGYDEAVLGLAREQVGARRARSKVAPHSAPPS